MTPAGHLSVSYLVGRAWPRLPMRAFLIGGLLPDIEFLLFPLAGFNEFHRVLTHNIFFVSLAGLVAAAFVGGMMYTRLIFLAAMFIGGALHLLVDAIIDNNPTNGIGVALFWPVTDWMFCPFNLVSPTAAGWNAPFEMVTHLWKSLMIEAPFYLAAVYLFYRGRSATPQDSA